jgi:hypothetical protein
LLNAVVDYKTKKIPRKKFIVQLIIWLIIFTSIASTKFIYDSLFSNHLTTTEPLSLFDVIEITGIILILFMANRSRIKLDALERKFQELHQELSIRISKDGVDNEK